MVEVLDDLFGLPVTSGGVGVLGSRQCAPGDALCRPHHPLESLVVAGSVAAVPGGDTARQNALSCTFVRVSAGLKICGGFGNKAMFLKFTAGRKLVPKLNRSVEFTWQGALLQHLLCFDAFLILLFFFKVFWLMFSKTPYPSV